VTARASSGRSVTHTGAWVRRTFGLPADWITGFTLVSSGPAPDPTPPSAPGGSTPASSVRPPHSLVPSGLSPVYSAPGAHTSGGKSWRTSCVRMASGGYRCAALVKGTRYARNAHGLWGPVVAWVQYRVSYFDRASSSVWRGNPRATPGRHVAGGRSLLTTCSPARATGHRTCWTSVLTSEVDRRPRAGGGYLYYRHWVWVRQSVAYLT